MDLDPPSTLSEQSCWVLSSGLNPDGAVRGTEIPRCQWGELAGGGAGFHSVDMVHDYKGKVVTLEELEPYTTHLKSQLDLSLTGKSRK